ncbi:MBL fold metallo-hydrolase [Sporosarcina sp. CAU 1771]
MEEKKPIRLNDRIHLIDGFDLGVAERTGTYVIAEDELTLVDTGPSSSVKYIKKGLASLGYTLDQVKYIIVTHIHLDHAGGAGFLLQDCPNAKVVVHGKGTRHLASPERLIAGAKAVYGDQFEALFEPIIPVPEDRLLVKGEGDTLTIGPNCTLEFLDTPGHANHHFSIYDPVSNGIFVGDTVGVFYESLVKDDVKLFLPSTSPNQFNPEAMQNAIERIDSMNLDTLYFGHFGMTNNPKETFRQVSEWLKIFTDEGKAVMSEQKGHEVLAERLIERIRTFLRSKDIRDDHEAYYLIKLDMEVSSMGIIDYLSK